MLLVLASAVACWALVAAYLLIGPAAVVLLVLMAIVAIVSGAVIAFSGLRTQRDALVWRLAIAGERGMPLGPALEAVADQCGFFFRRRVLRLAEMLDRGAPLPDARAMSPASCLATPRSSSASAGPRARSRPRSARPRRSGPNAAPPGLAWRRV